MAELDAFERRLRAALVRHVDGGPLDFDSLAFARMVAAREPRRHGLGSSLGWRGLVVPRVAWVVLLLAMLLAALVGGLLIAGSRPQPKFPAVVAPVLPAFECPAGANPDQPGPVDQVRPPATGYGPTPMVFDRRAGRIVALVARNGEPTQTWTFDVCTNTWTRMADAPVEPFLNPLVYDADSDLTITVDPKTRGVWTYHLASDTWTARGHAPPSENFDGGAPRFAYDPISGDVVQAFQAGLPVEPDLWSYDVERDEWTAISAGGLQDFPLLAYDASVDRFVMYESPYGRTTGTRLFDRRTGTWTQTGGGTPALTFGYGPSGNEITYDEAARRTVVFSGGRMIAYDAAADRWTEVYAGAPAADSGVCLGSRCRLGATTIYDPVNERLVVYGGMYRDPSRITANLADQSVQDDGVISFDLATGTWTVLVEATRTQ